MNGSVALTPEQETLLIPLVAKARQDAWSDPILPDETAAQVLRGLGRTVPTLPVLRGDAFGLALRARQLDQWTTAFLMRQPAATVLHLGCGLDGRIDRVRPSPQVRWFDLDLPEVIALRRAVYPRTEGPGYQMIGAPVTNGQWLAQVPTDLPTLIVAEGLLMYLPEADVRQLVIRLSETFSSGELLLDALSPLGTRLGAWHPALRASGARLRWSLRDPRQLMAWAPHMTLLEHVGLLDLPGFARLRSLERLAWRTVRRIPTLREFHQLLRYRLS
ncbi:class I SAM-dependent methyltransferase [Deinococcus multiflagellatus]|uniref:Class I SAM-dependent methyltransferase n=1 Tax=Deinococcus multiflagellatus TaxID=1656887 RepID=A0ABW1ZPE7_9DEIO|nr:class I SAM-dependent methyltransferase [Deinococcus multiflagellatus]MBZ9715694.1 class I SAM-dependent methyltransferase [Deinococcus multiflagellatus]